MNLQPVIDRLKMAGSPFKNVEGAANLAAIKSIKVTVTPAAFVIPITETPGANKTAGAVVQVTRERFGVVIVSRNRSDMRGAAAYDGGLDTAKTFCHQKLLGWTPDTGRTMCTFAAGQLIDLIDGDIWWRNDYETTRQDRSV